ncbi:MAG: hypothetical protein RSA66_09240 [Muribaculaceae bacterium]
MNNTTIKYITKVEVIESRWLANIAIIDNNEVILKYPRNFQKLQTVGLTSVEVSDKIDNRNRIFTVKMQAFLPSIFEVQHRNLSFRITTASGEQYLIGTNVHPYAVVTINDKFPSSVTEKVGCLLNVEYSNTFGMLSIID